MATYDKLEPAQKELMEKLSKIGLATAIQVFNNVIIETPFDKGRARGNWQCTIGNPATSVLSEEAAKSNKTDVSSDMAPWKMTDVAYLTNNLPYIEPLETGTSTQRPNGWVRANVAKGQKALDDAIAKVGEK